MRRAAMLDIEEYLHLAIHAGSTGQYHASLTYLKEVLQRQPDHAFATYLLAVQHAELGLIERAMRGLERALEHEPKLEIARFQLGMLLLDADRRVEARKHFVLLQDARDRGFRLFVEGMIAIADDELPLAWQKLALGLAQPPSNPSLAALMRRVLERLATRMPSAAPAPTESGGDHTVLGAYAKAR
jgi:tetratricopeptide (TPR) repeat protein